MVHIHCVKTGLVILVAAIAVAYSPASGAGLSTYNQDFETMTPGQGYPPNDLSADGWNIYGFGWDADPYIGTPNLIYQYGPFDAANGADGSIQGVAVGEGGPSQGQVVLSKYSDYNNTDQPTLYIQALTYQERIIEAGDVGVWRFSYDAKIGNLEADSSAFAYIQVLDSTTFFQTAFVAEDSTNLPTEWGTYALDVFIDASMVEDILSFGFSATSTNYNGSAVFYDNLRFGRPDYDGDGVHNSVDNCVQDANADQHDTNGDGFGNICDPDLNDDCAVNFLDLGLMRSVFFTNYPDADLNSDGIVNFIDVGIMKARFFLPPGPSGAPNVCDGS